MAGVRKKKILPLRQHPQISRLFLEQLFEVNIYLNIFEFTIYFVFISSKNVGLVKQKFIFYC